MLKDRETVREFKADPSWRQNVLTFLQGRGERILYFVGDYAMTHSGFRVYRSGYITKTPRAI